jgi:NAD(P)-dependent dehydrogenase (short-subunit alcohol dehydrogenase family)
MATETALIVGAGRGLSASLTRLFAREGMTVAVVEKLFADVVASQGVPDIVVFNASNRGGRGPITDLDPEAVRQAVLISCYGGFLVGQAAARLMLERGSGTILLTGASASYKGYANSSSFAMGKFGLRGLAQSMARELAPQNIHVAHFPIDGGIRQGEDDPRASKRGEDGLLDPAAIAETYLHVHRQHRSAWSWEIELRPWSESF